MKQLLNVNQMIIMRNDIPYIKRIMLNFVETLNK